jgi:hypothetical protein
LFFAFGALMCALSAIMLPFIGTGHPLWRIPALAVMGTEAVSWLAFVCLICLVAAFGLWRCSYWGFLAAVVLLLLGVAVHFMRALVSNDWWRLLTIGAIGVLVFVYLGSRARLFVHHGS